MSDDKPEWTLIPTWNTLEDVVRVFGFGQDKYSRDGWKTVDREKYMNSLMRHVKAYMMGEKEDVESRRPTLAHVICNAMILDWMDKNTPL